MCNGVHISFICAEIRTCGSFWMMINVYLKMVVRKPAYQKRWLEFQGCCMYVIVRVCEPLLFLATKPGSSAKQHRLNNYDIDCVIIWDARGV